MTPKGQSPTGVGCLARPVTGSSSPWHCLLSLCAFSHQRWRKRSPRSTWWRLESSTPITTLLRGQPKWCSTTSTRATDPRAGCLGCTGSTALTHRSVVGWRQWKCSNLHWKVETPELNWWVFLFPFRMWTIRVEIINLRWKLRRLSAM